MSELFEMEAILSEIAATKDMLEFTPATDKIGRAGLQQRLSQLENELSIANKEHRTFAETVLYFGGAPVEGSIGVSAAFATEALSKYQDLITSVFASQKCNTKLLETGPLPCRQESTLHITGTPRGSFGFQLKEISQQGQLVDSSLSIAVEKATYLIQLAKETEQGAFQEAIAEENPRVLGFLKDFLKTLSTAKSSARIVTREHDVKLDVDGVSSATTNIETTEVRTYSLDVQGIFHGARILSRDFDFLSDDGTTIRGRISQEIPDDLIHTMDLEYTGKRCVASLLVTEVQKKNSPIIKKKWVLSDIRPQ